MKSSFQIEINNPCQQNWDFMVPNNEGRYCTTCQLSVIDFTDKTPDEISDYLNRNINNHICGHVKRSDVKPQNKIDLLIFKLNNSRFKYISTLIIGMLLITGCRTKKSTTTYVNGRILSDKKTNQQTEQIQNGIKPSTRI